MTLILDIILRLAVWLLLAPLLPGIINKVKPGWRAAAGRRCSSFIMTWRACGRRASC